MKDEYKIINDNFNSVGLPDVIDEDNNLTNCGLIILVWIGIGIANIVFNKLKEQKK